MEFSSLTSTTAADWHGWGGRNFDVRGDGIALSTDPALSATDLGFDAVDLDVARDGDVYALRPGGDLYRYNQARELAQSLWTNGDREGVADPRAICVVGDRVYVADGATGDLAVVSARLQRSVGVVEAALADPVELVADGQNIYILDRGPAGEDGRVATVRRRGKVETVVDGLADPWDLTVDDAGDLYVLDQVEGDRVVHAYEANAAESAEPFPRRRTVDAFELDGTKESFDPVCIEALGDGTLVFGARMIATGDPAVVYHRVTDGIDSFERREGFDREPAQLVAGPRGGSGLYATVYAVADDRRVVALDETRTNRENPTTGLYSAQAFRRFDSGSDDTQWHRVKLAFDHLASSTQVRVHYYASNQAQQLPEGVASIEGIGPDEAATLRNVGVRSVWDLLELDAGTLATAVGDETIDRASEWLDRATTVVDEEWRRKWTTLDDPNPRDALLRGAHGRYLHVEIELVGSVDTSPRVAEFRAYCPRQTYLRYLPELYQEDERSAAFLEQFLSVFESVFVDVEEEIESLTRYFDPHGVSGEYLEWLGDWLAVDPDDAWPESARRELLVRGPELFKMRGTRRGMREMLRLYLKHVEAPNTAWMVEWEKNRIETRVDEDRESRSSADAAIERLDEMAESRYDGHLLTLLEPGDLDPVEEAPARAPFEIHTRGPRSFVVFVGPFVHREHREAVERIVADQKPAHTDANVVELEQSFKLGGETFLGVNSTLTARDFRLGRSTLGGDTVLDERDGLS